MSAPSPGAGNAPKSAAVRRQLRIAAVEGHFPRYRWDGHGRTRWDRAGAQFLQIVTVSCLFAVLCLDGPLLWRGAKVPLLPFEVLGRSAAGILALVFLVVGNGLLLDLYLASKTCQERRVPAWLRAFRLGTVAVPVLGLCALPAWKSIVAQHPAWAFKALPPLSLALAAPWVDRRPWYTIGLEKLDRWRRSKAQRLPWLVSWLVLGEILPFFFVVSWLASGARGSSAQRAACLTGSIVCHAIACAAALRYGWLRSRELRATGSLAWRLRLGPVLTLSPYLLSVLGVLTWWTGAAENREEITLVHAVWQAGGRASRALPGAIVPSDGSGRTGGLRRVVRALSAPLDGAEAMRRTLYRLKVLSLFLEAAAAAWLLSAWQPSLRRPDAWPPVLAVPAGLAVLGLIVEAVFLTMSSTRRRGPAAAQALPPYGRYLFLTQLALVSGLSLGFGVAARDLGPPGVALVAVGLGGVTALTLVYAPLSSLVTPPARQFQNLLAWTGLFFVLTTAGATLAGEAPPTVSAVRHFTVAFSLTPVWSCALGLAFLPWLLRPFGLRHLFDRRAPRGVRATLAGLAVTALVPLGGLAIPWWIAAQRRLMAAYEPASPDR